MSMETTELLRDSVIGACGELADTGWHPQAWTALDEIGVTALVVPEVNGGAGATYADAAVVLPALGSLAASVPIVELGLMAGWLVTLTGSKLPAGVVIAAVADDIDAQRSGGGWLLSGAVPRVPWARHADRVMILTRLAADWYAVDLPCAGLDIRHGANVAGEPRDSIVLNDLVVRDDQMHRLGNAGALGVELRRRGAFGRSLMMAGAAQSIYAYTVQYAGERHQFGRALAAMPAVQQMLAQLAAETSAMTVAVESAALALDRDPLQTWPLDAARIRADAAVQTVTAIGHQIHGAIGFTREHPLHRLTARLWAWREEYHNQSTWADVFGENLCRKGDLTLWQQLTM
ncbi:MAG TPA: acyl-CoA dehydrogenase family protein [Mycobacterium sp.]|jgi:acyl-CoA dehydrogenase|nr:acyl-CoA dehydrogenase family protein [Mycobacterium sp.]